MFDLEQCLSCSSDVCWFLVEGSHLDFILDPDDLGLLDSLQGLLGDALALIVEKSVGVSDPSHSSQKDTMVKFGHSLETI